MSIIKCAHILRQVFYMGGACGAYWNMKMLTKY